MTDTPDTSPEAPPKDFWTSDKTIKQVIAKLDAKRERQHDLSGVHYPPDQDCRMAAWVIQALAAERDALKAELASGSFYQEKDIDDLEARAEAAEAKLEACAAENKDIARSRDDWRRGWYALQQDTAAELATGRKRAEAAEAEVARLRDYIAEAPDSCPVAALRKCEAALADIAEGEPDPDDTAEKIWCKGRAAEGLRVARAALRAVKEAGGE